MHDYCFCVHGTAAISSCSRRSLMFNFNLQIIIIITLFLINEYCEQNVKKKS